jgi:hypothetical protein
LEKAISGSQRAGPSEAKSEPMAAVLKRIADQHRGYGEQAEGRKAIHKIPGKISISRPKVKLASTITALTMKYRRERESLPVKRPGLIRSANTVQVDS